MTISNLKTVAEIAGYITGIFALIMLVVTPLRKKIAFVLGTKRAETEAIKCLLRKNMLNLYFRNKDSKTIRQYELEEFLLEYKAYKALGGNSFIDEIYKEVIKFEVVT